MKNILNFILFFLVITLAVTMVDCYLYNNIKSVHEYKNNVIENVKSKRTISKELYCMTKDAVEFKIEVAHYANIINQYQMYNEIKTYFANLYYKDIKHKFIEIYPHLINLYGSDADDLIYIYLYESDNKTYTKFKYI